MHNFCAKCSNTPQNPPDMDKVTKFLSPVILPIILTLISLLVFELILKVIDRWSQQLFTSLFDLHWWELIALLLLSVASWFFTQRIGARKFLPLIGFLALIWLALSLIGKNIYNVDFHFSQVILSLFVPAIAAHFKQLREIDNDFTENLQKLSSFSYLFEAKTAEQRIESTLKLLKAMLPISEAIIFYLFNGELKQVGRMRSGVKSLEDTSTARQTAWQERIKLCEESILSGETKAITDEENKRARIAVPLVTDSEQVGALYVEINSDFQKEDQHLLEAISEQLARNFQRKEIRKKGLPNKAWWSFLSTELAENRRDLLKLIKNNIKEQALSVAATSYLKEAFAVAYLDGTIAYLNRQMRHLANLKNENLADIDLFSLLDHFKTEVFNEPRLALRKILQTGETYENELFFEATGKTLKIQITLVEVASNDALHETGLSTKPACFLVVINDITVIKENEKLRSDMVNLMSHEIRTPLTSIQGFAEILMLDDTISAENKEYISTIFNESQRLSRMLNTFLSIARLEQSDKQEFQKIPVKLDNVVSEVVQEMQEKARRKRIRLVEKADANLPPIAADKGLVAKAISHLIDNAIKYSPERTSVIISTVLEPEYVRVTVEDRGYGIPKEEQEKIWQKFYRIAREGHDKEEESTGLGLALVKEIVERHGGLVDVESEVGFGSKFSIRLPRL